MFCVRTARAKSQVGPYSTSAHGVAALCTHCSGLAGRTVGWALDVGKNESKCKQRALSQMVWRATLRCWAAKPSSSAAAKCGVVQHVVLIEHHDSTQATSERSYRQAVLGTEQAEPKTRKRPNACLTPATCATWTPTCVGAPVAAEAIKLLSHW